MRYYVGLVLALFCFTANAQEDYSTLIRQAGAFEQDSAQQRKALDLYLEAFDNYPDSITENDQYWFTVLSAALQENDLTFKYLIPLAELEKDESGFPGWDLIVGDYAEEDYHNLFSDQRWIELKQKALEERELFYKELQKDEDEFYSIEQNSLDEIKDLKLLFNEMKNFNPYRAKKDRDYSISFNVNDSTQTSFFIHLPPNYNPERKYSLLFFLHGAVRGNVLSLFQTAELNLNDWNRYYTKYAEENEVILVFPKGSSQYNWMSPDAGFFMIPEMLKLIKKTINIDDNKVFISGHSNGATGSFSYLMKQPTQFAGFYGFNTYPKVFTGGTFVENIKNRSFINFSTDEDYYYPPNANDDLTKLMSRINADYKDYRYNGFPHWFPEFDESEPAVQILFEDVKNRERKPFPKEISWEFDDEKYGNIDWLSEIKLDTIIPKSDWAKELNFKITTWLNYDENDQLISQEVDRDAFDFPRKSGKVKAEYGGNVFQLKTSNIESVAINISPEMVNLKKKVKVYINGKLYFTEKIKYNREFMLQNFEENKDREQVWIDQIKLNI